MVLALSRREFLAGSALSIVASALPSNKLEAYFPHGIGNVAAAFNGGSTQANFNFLQAQGDFPFLNMLLHYGPWGLLDNTPGSPIFAGVTLDSNGYPTTTNASLPHGGIGILTFLPNQYQRPGNYVIDWSGNGTIYNGSGAAAVYAGASFVAGATTQLVVSPSNFTGGVSVAVGQTFTGSGATGTGWTALNGTVTVVAVNGSSITLNVNTVGASGQPGGTYLLTSTKTNPSTTSGGRYEIVILQTQTSSQVGIFANGTVPITNMRMLHVNDIAAYNSGQIFNSTFIAALRALNAGSYRFLNWVGSSSQGTNYTNLTTWSTRKPTTYAYYGGDEYRSSMLASSVSCANNGQDFQATYNSGTLADKLTMHIQFVGASVTSVVGNGTIATVTTANPHGLNSSTTTYQATLANNSVSAFNAQTAPITVTGANTFTFASSTNATGTGGQFAILNVLTTASALFSLDGSNHLIATWANHGLANNDPVSFALQGGVFPPLTAGSLCSGVTYYAQVIDANTFNLAATPSGSLLTASSIPGGSTYSIARNPTISINGGTTAVSIKAEAAEPFIASYQTAPRLIAGVTMVYDAPCNSWLKFSSGTSPSGISSGCPPEICVQLCALLGAHPYFISPFLAVDNPTDWNFQLASYCKNSGPSWMVPRFELTTNELWNGSWLGTSFSYMRAQLYGWASPYDYQNWGGLIASTGGQLVSAAYGGSGIGTKYHTLVAIQSVFANSVANLSGSVPKLTSGNYVGGVPSPPTGYVTAPGAVTPFTFLASAAYNWCSAIAMAQYITPGWLKSNQQVGNAYSWHIGQGSDMSGPAAFLDSFLINTGPGYNGGTLADCAVWYSNFATWTNQFRSTGTYAGKITTMLGYEGGYSGYDLGAATTDPFGVITAMTPTNPCVITVPNTTVNGVSNSNSANSAFAVGMYVKLSGLTGSWATYNYVASSNNQYLVQSVSGGSITLALDASSQSGSMTGTATIAFPDTQFTATCAGSLLTVTAVSVGMLYSGQTIRINGTTAAISPGTGGFLTGSGTLGGPGIYVLSTSQTVSTPTAMTGIAAAGLIMNHMCAAPNGVKAVTSSPSSANGLIGYTFGGSYTDSASNIVGGNINNWENVGGTFPALFQTAGAGVWGSQDPNFYITTNSPQWQGNINANH